MPDRYRFIRLYVPGRMTPGRVDRVTSSFTAIYNTMLWVPGAPRGPHGSDMTYKPIAPGRMGHISPIDTSPWAHRSVGMKRRTARVPSGRFAFTLDPASSSQVLKIKSVVPVGSFEVGLSGVGEAIDAAAEVADPLRRRERKEGLRSRKELNLSAERSAHLDNQLKSIELLDRQIATMLKLVDAGVISKKQAKQAVANLLRTQDESAKVLEESRVKIIEIADTRDSDD